MTHESAGVGQEFPIRPERQFECAVADEVVSSMVTEHGFVQGPVIRVARAVKAVTVVYTKSPAPRVRRLIGEAVGEAFRHLRSIPGFEIQ